MIILVPPSAHDKLNVEAQYKGQWNKIFVVSDMAGDTFECSVGKGSETKADHPNQGRSPQPW